MKKRKLKEEEEEYIENYEDLLRRPTTAYEDLLRRPTIAWS